jgi:hypothetical protein
LLLQRLSLVRGGAGLTVQRIQGCISLRLSAVELRMQTI